ncbi:MAG: DegT/DnrJ/EryC1/StrS family aminotransferase [Ferrovibrio sp.]|uniref:DegT/DnrJ/EryC1/StrS family aminotransferase n=1 Tax=Ferrovibrio sp. TaxID=1917215 RepID=UPI00260A4863|nr:DegT/DnrJ/EryC1/StrS family aminotransferase [Ferrovibrio sp.]MCW0234963.1 DegT/DnrJ/EryC1/StrS family aminotransferase [Ferrovibrio sp.]
MTVAPVAFVDLQAQRQRLGSRIDEALTRVLDHGIFIMGPEVVELERQLSAFCGAAETITCANGTDAITLVMMAEQIGEGDAVFMPSFTFVATAEATVLRGATPYFVDVGLDDFAIDPDALEVAITDARQRGLRPRAILAVDLFGLPADYNRLHAIAQQHAMLLVADAAQSFGGQYHNRMVGDLADYTTTSFFPAKPLGCYGDGGAIFTADAARADLLRSLRFHGKGEDKYDNVRIGLNSRLDTLQAAILLEKLRIFRDELMTRERVAARYDTLLKLLAPALVVPKIPQGLRSAWAQYTVRSAARDRIIAACRARDIPVNIYYPIPLHKQAGYRQYPASPDGLPVSERLSREVVSLPMHPYLSDDQQDEIAAIVKSALT